MKNTAIIMAGGSGERFWPLSRQEKPKQILNLTSENRSMIQETLDRVEGLISPEDVYIITSSILLEPIRKALPQLPPENVIAEPAKRNTAPCLALGAGFIKEKYKNQYKENEICIAILTADHNIKPIEKFKETAKAALDYVGKNKVLATIGIPPVYPATGFGYIETETPFEDKNKAEIKKVISFKEKPDLPTAESYVKSGSYHWNSGMFFWRLDTFEENMIKCLPSVGNEISKLSKGYADKTDYTFESYNQKIEDIFSGFPNESIDYGLMEKADDVVVVQALFDWDDIGSINALERVYGKDENQNVIKGNVSQLDSTGSILLNTDDKKLLGVFGVEDLAVVSTEDAILVCPRNKADELKKLIAKIKENGKTDWL